MPQSITFNGIQTLKPGVYAEIDTSALSGSVTDINRVAVVGDFPFLASNTPTTVTSAASLVGLEFSDYTLKLLTKLLYNGSGDAAVAGGPSAVTLVNANQTVVAASKTLTDASDKDSLVLTSSWTGKIGNKTVVNYLVNPDTATLTDFVISRDGVSDTFSAGGSRADMTIAHSTAGMDADVTLVSQTLTYGPTTGIKVAQSFSVNKADTFTTEGLAFDGTITATANMQPGADGSNAIGITINGTTSAGVVLSEILTPVIDADTTTTTSSNSWKAVTSIIVEDPTATIPADSVVITFTNDAFAITPTDAANQGAAADIINADSTNGFTATLSTAKAGKFALSTLDEASLGDIKGSSGILHSFLQSVIDDINTNSALVIATRATISESSDTGVLRPKDSAEVTTMLVGGSQAASVNSAAYKTAIDTLDKSRNIQIIVTLDDGDIEVAKHVRNHCVHMAGKGESEVCGFWGAASNSSLATLQANANALNTRHVAQAGQDLTLVDHLGNTVAATPQWGAVILTGIMAGTAIATPLTRKRLDILKTHENGWSAANDLEAAIDSGFVLISKDRIGFFVERSVTTWVEDDNPIFSEVSANESVNTCIRDLRNYVDSRIGDANDAGLAEIVKQICMTRLKQQVLDSIIKAFNKDTLTVVDLGDRLRVDVRIAAVEPLNFILIHAEVVRNVNS